MTLLAKQVKNLFGKIYRLHAKQYHLVKFNTLKIISC